MERTYGPKKAESVLYASKNAGKISGIDAICDSVARLSARIDRFLGRRADDFSEADHPRAEDGRVGNKAGSHGGEEKTSRTTGHEAAKTVEGKRVTGEGKALPAHIAALKIPPAWTDVTFNPDPKGELLATGKDAKGRRQAVYSAEFAGKQAAAKFARISELSQKFEAISAQNEEARK